MDKDYLREISVVYLDKLFDLESGFYKIMLTVSTGAVFVSASFIDKLVPLETAECVPMLLIAWGIFCADIVLLCYGLIFTAFYKDQVVGATSSYVLNGNDEALGNKMRNIDKHSWKLYRNVSVSVSLFILASTSMLLFIYHNLVVVPLN